jgi:hypothetical protein
METILIIFLATIFTAFAGVGATIIITKSFLFRPLQRLYDPEFSEMHADVHPKLNKLFNCPLCMGAWVGFVFQLAVMITVRLVLHITPLLNYTDIVAIFFQGCIVSILSYITYLILVKLGHNNQ